MSDYFEIRKWRRLALLSFGAFVLVATFSLYQAYRIKVDEAWMVRAYNGLVVCRQLLEPQVH